ncbi:hypothetical protein EHO58_05490 [Leptospira selangorensis]|nr:hypothetical protein EHO58_05490 [Leptospira selangorensis]
MAKKLSNLGLSPKGEYEYYKHNNNGDRQLFSIDNQGLLVDEDNKIKIELLVEAKYSKESNWIFFADPNLREYKPNAYCGIVPASILSFDILTKIKTKTDYSEAILEYSAYGIEASKEKENYNRIVSACRQLQWAFVDKYINYHVYRGAIPQTIDIDSGYLKFFAMIILTNAELLKIKDEVTLEQMKTSSIESLVTKEEIIPFFMRIDNDLKNQAVAETQRINAIGVYDNKDVRDYFQQDKIYRSFSGIITEAPTIYWISSIESLDKLCKQLVDYARLWLQYKESVV